MTKLTELLHRYIKFLEGVANRLKYFLNRKILRKRRLHSELAAVATWKIGIRRFEKDVQLPELQFVFLQAENLLKDTVEGSQQIVTRTNIVITISAGALIFLGGHIGGMLARKNIEHIRNVDILTFIQYHLTFIPACFLAVSLVIILLRLTTHLIGLDYYTIGSQPKQLFVRQYYEDANAELPTLIKMYLGEMEEYQFRITENLAKNERRWDQLNHLIFWTLVITMTAVVLFVMELLFCF